MILFLIVFLLLVIFLSLFIGFNLSNTCSFWFFKTFSDLPVTVLFFIAFAAGMIFSILLVSIYKFNKKTVSLKNNSDKQIKKSENIIKKTDKSNNE